MEILWYEGFEPYGPTTLVSGTIDMMSQNGWAQATGGGFNISIVRTGTYAFQSTAGFALRRSLRNGYEYVGTTFGLYLEELPTVGATGGHIFAQFRDLDNRAHVGLKVGTTGKIQAWLGGYDKLSSNGTLIGQSTLELAPGTFNHIEFKLHVHASAGSVRIKVNGRDFLMVTGINTVGPDTTYDTAFQVAWGYFDGSKSFDFPGSDVIHLDDIVAVHFDDGGSEEATFLGQYGVYFLPPIADTTYADWLLTTGTDGFALIDEIPPDEGGSFIYAESVGNKSAFAPTPLPSNINNIAAITPLIRAEKTDTGDCAVQCGVVSGGTEYDDGQDNPVTTTWSYYQGDVRQIDPNSSGAWDPLHLPNMLVERTE